MRATFTLQPNRRHHLRLIVALWIAAISTAAVVAPLFSPKRAEAWQGTPVINNFTVTHTFGYNYHVSGDVTGCTPIAQTIVEFGGVLEGSSANVNDKGEFGLDFTAFPGQTVTAEAVNEGLRSQTESGTTPPPQ